MKFRGQLLTCLKFVGPACLALCLFRFVHDYGEYSSAVAAQIWRPVPIRIKSCDVGHKHVYRGSDYYRPEIRYDYEVNGKNHEGDRLGFLFPEAFDHSSAGRLAAMHIALGLASRSQAYYNPNDPTQSVLSIGHDYAKEFKQRTSDQIKAGILAVIFLVGVFVGWDDYCSIDDRPAYARAITKPTR